MNPHPAKTMLKSILTAGLLFAAVVFFSIRHIAPALPPFVGPPDYRESRNLSLPAASHVLVDNADGAVKIVTSAEPTISVQADIRLYGGADTAAETLENYAASLVQVAHDGDKLEILSEPNARIAGADLSIAYVITVPEGTDIDVIGSNGNVHVAEGCGRVAVYGGNSDIEIVEPRGIVIAKSANGRIRLVNARDDATLEAVNGSIYADMHDGALEAHTTNGNVIVRVLTPEVSRCTLGSENGSITIALAFDTFQYELTTGRGFIKSDFTLAEDLGAGVLDTKQVKGTLGDATTVLMADALNGNIWLKRN